MQQIAKNTDTSAQRLAEGTAFAPTENRLEYLKRGSTLAGYLIKNESFNRSIEAKTPKVAAENSVATLIDAGITISDLDRNNLSSATVTVSNGFVSGDSLGFNSQNGITGGYNATTGVLTLTGSSLIANYQTALRSVTFSTNVDNPTATSVSRTMTWVVNDSSGLNWAAASSTILISPVNDAPASSPTCSTLSSGNIFRTGLALGGGWTLDSCSGATDIDGDALTYRLDLAETGSSSSASYSCPTPIFSSSGGTSVAGNFPNGVGVYGSWRY